MPSPIITIAAAGIYLRVQLNQGEISDSTRINTATAWMGYEKIWVHNLPCLFYFAFTTQNIKNSKVSRAFSAVSHQILVTDSQ